MSYGDGPRWLSPYTYTALFNSGFHGSRGLFGARPRAESLFALGNVLDGSLPQIFHHSMSPVNRFPSFVLSQSGEYLFVSGRILPNGKVELQPFFTGKIRGGRGVRQGSGPYTLELQGRNGGVLSVSQFDKAAVRDSFKADPFHVVVPLPGALARIVIKEDDRILASREVSRNAPKIQLTSPNGGETWPNAGSATITWKAEDPDGDALTFALHYSIDGGKSWRLIASRLQGSSYETDVSWLAGSRNAKLRVTCTDGVNTSRDESDSFFTIPRKAPQVTIFVPQTGSVMNLRQMIAFEGTASDYEYPDLPNSALTWVSNRDGMLGTGRRIDLKNLSVGEHRITLTAIDSDGQKGTTSVTVQVQRQ